MRRFLASRGRVALAVGVLLAGVSALVFARDGNSAGAAASIVPVTQGDFTVVVTTAGELRARKFVQITLPQNTQQAEAYQLKIQTIVPEGTVVKTGDVVADLDRSPLASKMQEVTLALQKAEAQHTQAQLDTTLTLSQAREDLRNMQLQLEEKRIAKDQAQFEAPSVRRQAEIDLEKATRALAKATTDYKTKQEQAAAKMREVGSDLDRQRNRLGIIQAVMEGFTIRAPSDGMVIYVKEWNGRKKTAGSQITPWEPTVATLPDLSQMESVTYLNEIDVRKVAVNQPVRISLDADPTKVLEGVVSQVANVGEQRPNSDAKVFEVHVNITKPDTTLRPGMTTSNAVLTNTIKNALSVPLEAVHGDSTTTFVYKRTGSGIVRQEVVTGVMNDDEVVIAAGLTASDRVLLSAPADGLKLSLQALPPSARPVPRGDTAVGTRKVGAP
ncbi:MAG: efflux RND transporter periplasmic adaptor subunit [Gemmatimonas sp.]|jgi:RND family efflux transporter MFP subunit|uniref:efflux RND transporter periplasmic adaptor subunit n=1 Tax=Gemmatimonas sp. TaxID=1962908 RepID=UPI00391FBCB4|nr:efflux RND transporter periplasmic adaptor subunit [Gemmatimonadota bacterium]